MQQITRLEYPLLPIVLILKTALSVAGDEKGPHGEPFSLHYGDALRRQSAGVS
jgi:hypothetical protein